MIDNMSTDLKSVWLKDETTSIKSVLDPMLQGLGKLMVDLRSTNPNLQGERISRKTKIPVT